ncbi:hypothetical protein IAQ61_002842 [Plenodomus lingam]|uniref:Predicted protein n=1 Tax=Leptosphaeria maculans (strain JN3 / isolate v23.1.3 / race Av1-4-5-6-7-8) TaxID=985895 RepID=E5A8J0_LEPMJ|nr:predicted protein [Plenodomus lingam JN3]KAH9877475.1 hypothetical protein IAQ61_002842 [Plenodomus lingam]CBX99935.1 predicted protein [Plenodomus lingam JN3]
MSNAPKSTSFTGTVAQASHQNPQKPLDRVQHLARYWDENEWREYFQFYLRSPADTIHPIAECLGLRLKRLHPNSNQFVFESPIANVLAKEIEHMAGQIQAHTQRLRDLLQCAANPQFLEAQLAILLRVYASQIWGVCSNRTFLVNAGDGEFYPRDLLFESTESRDFIRALLHQWIFRRAFARVKFHGGEDNRNVSDLIHAPKQNAHMPLAHAHPADIGFAPPALPTPVPQPQPGPTNPRNTQPSILPANKTTSIEEVTAALIHSFRSHALRYGKPGFNETASLNRISANTASFVFSYSAHDSTGPAPSIPEFSRIVRAWLAYQHSIISVSNEVGALTLGAMSATMRAVSKFQLKEQLNHARKDFINSGTAAPGDEAGVERALCRGIEVLCVDPKVSLHLWIANNLRVQKMRKRVFDLLDVLNSGE